MKLTGILRFVDLGPGQWMLETSQGKVALYGDIDRSMADRRVEVEGTDVPDAQSISMTGGKALMVGSIRQV